MHCEALEKVLGIARKNPRILLSPAFFQKICARLDINTEQAADKLSFSKEGREVDVVVINHENCGEYKCVVREGKDGIRIFEFINALVKLLTDTDIPPSPYDKVGQTADFYCKHGINILEEKFLANNC